MERRGPAVALFFVASLMWADDDVRADLARSGTENGIQETGLPMAPEGSGPVAGNPWFPGAWTILEGQSRQPGGPFGIDVRPPNTELAFEAPAGGEVKLFARPNFSPLVDAAGPGGFFSVIMTRAFEKAGYQPSLDLSSEGGAAGDLRGVNFPHPHDPAGEASSIYSIPIISMRILASVRKDADIAVDGIADLAGLTVCADEAVLALVLQAAAQAEIAGVEGVSKPAVACFNDLLNGNVDVVLAEPEQSAFVMEQPEAGRLLTTGDEPIELGTLHATMPRFSPYSSSMMYHLNNALAEMIQSGEIDAIMSEGRAERVSAEGGPLFPAPEPIEDGAAAEEPRKGRSEPLNGATM